MASCRIRVTCLLPAAGSESRARAAVCPTRLLAPRRSPRRAAPSAAASRRDARPSVAGTVARRAAVQSHSQPRGSLWLSALLHCVRPRPALWIAMDAAWMAMTVVAEAGPPRPPAPGPPARCLGRTPTPAHRGPPRPAALGPVPARGASRRPTAHGRARRSARGAAGVAPSRRRRSCGRGLRRRGGGEAG